MNAGSSISLVLLTYNQADTAADAARSCLAQEGPPIEIILSDDASADGTCRVLEQVALAYDGPHRVRLNCNERNLGIAQHLNRLASLASGELIVEAAGDDLSLPGRVQRIAQAWEQTGRRADLIAHALIDMSSDGRDQGTIRVDDLARWRSADDWVTRRPHVIGAGHAWTKRLFDRFGPLADGIAYEDQVLTLRALLSGGALTIDEPLVRYRRGGTSGKARGTTRDAVLERMRVQNARHLAELLQMRRDAQLAGASGVDATLQPELARQSYLQRLLAADDDWGKRVRTLVGAGPDVPALWRWRKFAGVSFAGMTALKHRLRERR
jgi:glycosyltransferase involved in cell wall biosynthesis